MQSHNFVRLTRMELVPWRRPASQRRWVPLPFNLLPATPIGKMLPGSRCPCNWGNTACEGPQRGGKERQKQRPQKPGLTCCLLYYICAAATLLVQEEEVLRVFPGMNAELRQSPCTLPSTPSSLYTLTTFSHSYTYFT